MRLGLLPRCRAPPASSSSRPWCWPGCGSERGRREGRRQGRSKKEEGRTGECDWWAWYDVCHPMRRRLFTILSAVSLALCLAVAASWVLSGDGTTSPISEYRSSVYQASGPRLACGFDRSGVVSLVQHPRPRNLRRAGFNAVCPYRSAARLGFRWQRSYWDSTGSYVANELLVVPWWFPCALTAIPPGIWLWVRLRSRRRPSDGMPHCAECDYNLTGNVSGICPECGAPVPADLVITPIH